MTLSLIPRLSFHFFRDSSLHTRSKKDGDQVNVLGVKSCVFVESLLLRYLVACCDRRSHVGVLLPLAHVEVNKIEWDCEAYGRHTRQTRVTEGLV